MEFLGGYWGAPKELVLDLCRPLPSYGLELRVGELRLTTLTEEACLMGEGLCGPKWSWLTAFCL